MQRMKPLKTYCSIALHITEPTLHWQSRRRKSLRAFGSHSNCIIFCYGKTLITKRMSRSWCELEEKSKLPIFINLRLHKIYNFFQICFSFMIFTKGISMTTTTFKMELFVALVNGRKPLTNVTKSSIDATEVLDCLTSLCTILVILKFIDQYC